MTGKCECDCCRINQLLNELGVLMLKRKCETLIRQGLSREEVNMMLTCGVFHNISDLITRLITRRRFLSRFGRAKSHRNPWAIGTTST
jgi:hypothetical protein